MKDFRRYLREHKIVVASFLAFYVLFIVIFYLYDLPMAALAYPMGLCLLLGFLILLVDYMYERRKHSELENLKDASAQLLEGLPASRTQIEEDYQEIIRGLCESQQRIESQMSVRYSDMVEYYTTWAHQIKTPIASMSLHLQSEDSPFSRQLSQDLFRIEQYAEMVLTFLRLGSSSTDYIFKEYDLDTIVKGAVKKFAGQFISKKLTLDYEPLNVKVVTDEKWLGFVIEQILSNALKYTNQGGIKITVEKEWSVAPSLCIEDTGIGIAPEDLPRIFEKGYTGYNGRSDKKASGIGLYLCRSICERLGHSIKAKSEIDKGTRIEIVLGHGKYSGL